MKELKNLRKRREKHFVDSTGLITAYVYDGDIHCLKNGKWEEIDNTIVDKGKYYQNKINEFDAIFTKTSPDLFNMVKDDDYLKMTYKNNESLELVRKGEKIEYHDLKNDILFDYEVKNNKLKESIVLKCKETIPEDLEFVVDTNLTLVLKENNRVEALNDLQEVIFTIDVPFMVDAKDEYNYDIHYELEKIENGYILKLALDHSWLAKTSTVFPVVIDPTIINQSNENNVYDTYIYEGDTDVDRNNQNMLLVGLDKNNRVYRTLLKFDLPEIGTGSQIIDAEINLAGVPILRGEEYTTSYIGVHEVTTSWTEETANWSTMHDKFNPRLEDFGDYLFSTYIIGDTEIKFTPLKVTNLAKKWYSGTPNNGVMLKAVDETRDKNVDACRFFSKNNTVTNGENVKPIIAITYRNQNGLESYMAYKSQGFASGASYVNAYNGNLTTAFDLISTVGGKMPANVVLYYNTNDVVLKNNYGYGLGYKINYHETIKETEIDGKTYYEFVDGDGTIHYFNEVDGIFKDEDGLNLTAEKTDTQFIVTDKEDNKKEYTIKSGVGYLDKIITNQGYTTTISYDTNNRIIKVKDANEASIDITYENDKIVLTNGFKTVTLNCNAKKQVTSLEKEDTITSFSYNDKDLISKITDVNGISLTYEYYSSPYRVKKITEYGLNATLGKEMNIVYGFNATTFTDHLGHKNTYTFNNVGNPISITSLDMHETLKDAFGKNTLYGDQYWKLENKLLSSEQLNKTIKNYIKNSSFEDGMDNYNISNGIAELSTTNARTGKNCVKLSDGGMFSVDQLLTPDETYTFSAFVKGTGTISLYVETWDEDTRLYEFESEEYTLTDEYQRYSLTFFLNLGFWENVRCFINYSDECYVDDLQLEIGEVANYYTLLDNSDFSDGLTGWSIDVADREGNYSEGTEEIVTLETGLKALKVKNNPYLSKTIGRHLNVSGKAGDEYIVSFWYKNMGLSSPTGQYPANCMISFGYTGVPEDEAFDIEPVVETLNFNETEWQYFSARFTALYDYEDMYLSILLLNNANEIYFTNFTMFKDLSGVDYDYDENGNVIQINDLNNNKTAFNYNENNQLIKMMDPQGANFSFEYDNDNSSQVLSGTSGTGIANEIEYDEFDNPRITKIKAVGTALNGKYYIRLKGTQKYLKGNYQTKELKLIEDTCSNEAWSIKKNGEHFTINSVLLPNYYINKNNDQTTLQKNTGIDFDLIKNDNGSYYIKYYNPNYTPENDGGNTSSDNHYNSENERYLKNDNGSVVFSALVENDPNFEFYFQDVTYPYFMENSATYTADGKFVETTTDTLFNTTHYNINPENGLVNSVTDPKGNVINYTYNSKDQITSVEQNNKKIEYVYNEQNNLSKIKSGTKEYNFTYDEFLKPTSVSIGDNITLINNEYEERNGNLKKTTYGNNDSISYSYDDLDRIKKIIKEDNTYSFKYDNFNNLAKIETDYFYTDDYTYGYDVSQRLVDYSFGSFKIKYDYDNNDNITNKVYRLDDLTQTKDFTYNKDNALTKSIMDSTTIDYTYDPLGRLVSRKLNGVCDTSYDYVTNGKRTSLLLNSLTCGTNKYSYKYDKLNNITHIYKNSELTNEYRYDIFNELIEEKNYIQNKKYVYEYDSEGNIVSKKVYDIDSNLLVEQKGYAYNNPNWEDQLTSYDGVNITYDEIGNPITIGSNITLAWQNGRELKEYKDTEKDITLSYKYNKDGIRISKTLNGLETKYYVEGKNILFENFNNNVLYYLRDGNSGLIGIKVNEDIYYYQKNAQEDIIGIVDNALNQVATYEYDAWGNIISIKDASGNEITDESHVAILNPYRYRSYYYDKETKLYYLNSRYYNPSWGRFINTDKHLGVNNDVFSYNLYLFCSNDPINNIEIDGASWWSAIKKGAAELANGAKNVAKKVSEKASEAWNGAKKFTSMAVDKAKSFLKTAKDNFFIDAGIGVGGSFKAKVLNTGIGVGAYQDLSWEMKDNSKYKSINGDVSIEAGVGFSKSYSHEYPFKKDEPSAFKHKAFDTVVIPDCKQTVNSYSVDVPIIGSFSKDTYSVSLIDIDLHMGIGFHIKIGWEFDI